MKQSDILIIGAGPGGYETAVEAARLGRSVVIIERGALGGTCLNAGCIPTKCLCHTAEVLDAVRSAAPLGIKAEGVTFSMAEAVAHKDAVVGALRQGVATLLRHPLIELVSGEARFVSPKVVAVGEAQYTAPTVIIAVGSQTSYLPIEGARAEGVLTSTELLSLREVPASLCIIGGGVIGMEMASVFRSFGAEVSVVEYCPEVLPAFDRDLAKRLRTALKRRGVSFHVGAAARAIHAGAPMRVEIEEKGRTLTLEAERVVMAVGRQANVGALNLDDVGIAYTRRGITVSARYETSVEGVYAIGDVNGQLQLAHAAAAQGRVVLGLLDDIGAVPAAVFTVPELAMVGTAEGTAHKAFYRANGKALTMCAEEGLVKLYTSSDGLICGAQILGAHAADLIHEVRLGEPLQAIARRVHAHPTLSELVWEAARSAS